MTAQHRAAPAGCEKTERQIGRERVGRAGPFRHRSADTLGLVANVSAERVRFGTAEPTRWSIAILVDGLSAILDYGRSVRKPPVDLYNAVLARDQGCRWPGCHRPASHCDAHHVTFWERDGRTKIDNLVLLCRRHHRRLHHQHWKARLEPDGTLHVTAPDGRVEATRPPGPIPQQFWRTDDGGDAQRTAA